MKRLIVAITVVGVALPVFALSQDLGRRLGGENGPRRAAAADQPAPKLPDGKVDLSGVWTGGGDGDISRLLKPGELDTIMQPWAKKLYAERNAVDGLDPYFSCMPWRAAANHGRIRVASDPASHDEHHTHLHAAGRQRAHIQANLPGWPQAPRGSQPDLVRTLDRSMGGRHTRRRHNRPERQVLAGPRRHAPYREASSGGAIHAHNFTTLRREVTVEDPGAFTRPFTVTLHRKAWNARKRDPRIHLYREQPVRSRSGACSSEYQEVRARLLFGGSGGVS